jgi:hypothetical protein
MDMRYLIDDSNPISRRVFTLEMAMSLLAGATITVAGCGDSNSTPSSPSPTPTPSGSSVTGAVAANHGHEATITAAQITAANALALNIQGTATHPHTVSLTGAQVSQIGSRQQVSVTTSTDNAHTHMVTFN